MKRWHAILLFIAMGLVGWLDAPPVNVNWTAECGQECYP